MTREVRPEEPAPSAETQDKSAAISLAQSPERLEARPSTFTEKPQCRSACPLRSPGTPTGVLGLGRWMVLLGSLLFTGCRPIPDASRCTAPTSPSATVRLQTVENESRTITEEVVGTVRAKTRATLEAKVSGRITALPLTVGQKVQAGELVARLDASEFAARLDQAEASLQQAESDQDRAARLFDQQATTRAEYEAAITRQRLAKGAAAEARALLSHVELVAPFDGVVTRKSVEVGDLATPGKPLVTLESSSELQVEADVPESLVSQIQCRAQLTCRIEASNADLLGVVREIAPNADPASRTVRVTLDLPTASGLRPGRFVRLLVPVGERHSLRVPLPAVVQRGQLELVFVLVNHRSQLRLVRTGRHFGDSVEIASGLDPGDRVVVDGGERLADGQRLEVE